MIRTVARFSLGAVFVLALAFGVFVFAVEHPATSGPTRCWLQETFYAQSWQDPPPGTPIIEATRVTDPVRDLCDAADDPAIWAWGEALFVLGTNKQRSLNVYDVKGALAGRADDLGAPNNVDMRALGTKVIAMASDKDDGEIEAFAFDPVTGTLGGLPGAPFPARVEEEAYGLCLYANADKTYVFTTDKSGLIVQYRIARESESGAYSTREERELRVPSQPEGCVVDDEANALFVGEEDVGVWRFDAGPEADTRGVLIAQTGPEGPLTADVEGLAIYRGAAMDEGFLIASSQGSNSYAVFDRAAPHAFRGQFQVQFDGELIGDTDGLDVSSQPVGPDFPKGLLVIQDGFIRTGGRNGAQKQTGDRRRQRFAYVSWEKVEDALGLDD